MMIRSLHTALALLLLVAPLGASLCGDCASGHCETSEASSVIVAPDVPDEPRATSHCHEAESVAEVASESEAAPCHDEAPALSACCAISAVPATEQAIAPASGFDVMVTLDAAVSAVRVAVVPNRVDQRHRPPSRPPSEPLYTLHGAFLI